MSRAKPPKGKAPATSGPTSTDPKTPATSGPTSTDPKTPSVAPAPARLPSMGQWDGSPGDIALTRAKDFLDGVLADHAPRASDHAIDENTTATLYTLGDACSLAVGLDNWPHALRTLRRAVRIAAARTDEDKDDFWPADVGVALQLIERFEDVADAWRGAQPAAAEAAE